MSRRRGPLTRAVNVISYFALRSFALGLNLIPYRSYDLVSRTLVALLYPVSGSFRRRTLDNLEPAFPELSPTQRRQLARRSMANAVRVFMEIAQNRVVARGEVEDVNQLLDDVNEIDTGVIGIQGHLGNWEIGIPHFSKLDRPGAIVVKHLRNPFIDRYIIRCRERYGAINVFSEDTRTLIRTLRSGGMIGMAADQNARKDGVFVEFFGRPAATFRGPAAFAYMTNVPCVLFASIHVGQGRYKMLGRWISRVPREEYSDQEAAVAGITEAWVSELEALVREHPDQYLWAHRRWRTRPPTRRGG
jgi:KDO2-lipid IV(A) lauroyltransferase